MNLFNFFRKVGTMGAAPPPIAADLVTHLENYGVKSAISVVVILQGMGYKEEHYKKLAIALKSWSERAK